MRPPPFPERMSPTSGGGARGSRAAALEPVDQRFPLGLVGPREILGQLVDAEAALVGANVVLCLAECRDVRELESVEVGVEFVPDQRVLAHAVGDDGHADLLALNLADLGEFGEELGGRLHVDVRRQYGNDNRVGVLDEVGELRAVRAGRGVFDDHVGVARHPGQAVLET